MSAASEAAEIKDAGNKLFVARQFSQAYDKYSKALKVGGDNAVIYANRSACLLALNRKQEALTDAKKSTELDPAYAKGWGRLGAAEADLEAWENSKAAYEKALSKLPKGELSGPEKKQKENYESGITTAERRLAPRPVIDRPHVMSSKGKKCWEAAREFLLKAKAQGRDEEVVNSSALVLNMAAADLREAKEDHAILQELNIRGRKAFSGKCGAIAGYCTAITTEPRAFYIDDNNFLKKYAKQVQMECTQRECTHWTTKGPEYIIDEAAHEVRLEGWDRIRPALALVIRAWIVRGHMESGLKRNFGEAVRMYDMAITAIRLGRKAFAYADKGDRGSTFEESFLFGVQKLILGDYVTSKGKDAKFTINGLEELADGVFAEVERARGELGVFDTRALGPEQYLAFYFYPAAEALVAKAFARKMRAQALSGDDSKRLWMQSGDLYLQAAQKFPKDDEHHCGFLTNALGSYWIAGDVPVKTTLPLLKSLEEDTPQMKEIWVNSAFALAGRDQVISMCLGFYTELQQKLESGDITLESVCNPPFTI